MGRGKEGEWSVITLTDVCSAVHCAANHVGSTVQAHARQNPSRDLTCLFNDAVKNEDYVKSNNMMNDEPETAWKEAIVAYVNTPRHLSKMIGRNKKKQNIQHKFGPNTTRIHV